MSKDFEISRLLELTKENKYEATVAGFEVIDNLEAVAIPRKMQTRKASIQALYALSEGLVQYAYIDEEKRARLIEELQDSERMQAETALNAVFSSPVSGGAPVVEDSDEELDEIGEVAEPETYSDPNDEESAPAAVAQEGSEALNSDASEETESDENEEPETEDVASADSESSADSDPDTDSESSTDRTPDTES